MHMSAVGFKVPYALNNGLRNNDSEWTGRANGGQWGPMGANGLDCGAVGRLQTICLDCR